MFGLDQLSSTVDAIQTWATFVAVTLGTIAVLLLLLLIVACQIYGRMK